MGEAISKIIVLGGGSAGLLSALALKTKLPTVDVVVIRSKDIGIIGVGEGSTISLTKFLHQYLKVDTAAFYRIARPTFKLGLRFIWGPRPYFNYTFGPGLEMRYEDMPKANGFYCDESIEYTDLISAMMSEDRVFEPAPTGIQFHDALAYHVENEFFVAYLEQWATQIGVRILDDTVREVRQNEAGIASLELQSGAGESGDLYVDCSGYGSLLLGKTLGEPFVSYKSSLFCDRAVVGGWARSDEIIKPYTSCETMNSGWAWQIEHENRINRGYVYSSDFISDADADAEFRVKNPKVERTRIVKFIAGRYQRNWVKNVVAIGNAAGFVEPLEATALAVIGMQAAMLAETLLAGDRVPTESHKRIYNDHHARTWDAIRGFIAVHYKFNTRIDTPFWRACWETTDLAYAAPIVEYYRENGPIAIWTQTLIDAYDQFKLAGYWTLMIGMKVPYHTDYVPDPQHVNLLNNKRLYFRQRAQNALTVRQALDLIHDPNWQWSS
jgi:tryptophan halogenase